MSGEVPGWINLPLHMQDDAIDRIMRSDLSEPAIRHASEIVTLGYTVIPAVVSPEHCKRVIGEFQRFYAQNAATLGVHRSERGLLPRVTNLHNALPILTQLFTRNKLLLEVQDFFFGRPTSLYTSLYYERGSEQPIHRDTPVFCTRPEYNYFGNTVYLEDTSDENGCLEVLVGGHKVGELDREALATKLYGAATAAPQLDNDIWNAYQKRVVDRCAAIGLKSKRLHLHAGDAIIWHPQLPHGGSPIRDVTRTRHSFVFHTAPVGTRVYHQNVFFNPSIPFPEMAEWDQVIADGRAIVHHDYGIALGDPVHKEFQLAQLNLSGLTRMETQRVSAQEARRLLA